MNEFVNDSSYSIPALLQEHSQPSLLQHSAIVFRNLLPLIAPLVWLMPTAKELICLLKPSHCQMPVNWAFEEVATKRTMALSKHGSYIGNFNILIKYQCSFDVFTCNWKLEYLQKCHRAMIKFCGGSGKLSLAVAFYIKDKNHLTRSTPAPRGVRRWVSSEFDICSPFLAERGRWLLKLLLKYHLKAKKGDLKTIWREEEVCKHENSK